jgi:TPP-dependent pyruvate/acetoin dehydrogenase alpha subunit
MTRTTHDLRAAPTPPTLLDLHRRMVRIRVFEEEAGRLMETGRIPGSLHLYVGQEAVAAGVCAALRDDDQITSTHRGHGHMVAKGGDFRRMYAELFAKATGANKGKGGSMHISDMEIGMLGANGIVGGGAPIAMGAAFANRYLGSSRVAVSFFGDGASNEGSLHEAANMAAVWRLPCIFVCENNGYGEFTPQAGHQVIEDIADRATGWGMPGVIVDGMDVVAVWEVAVQAVARARAGDGPTFIEAKTYRYYDHVGVKGMRIPYRTIEEEEVWRGRDPIAALELRLLQEGVLSTEQAAACHADALAEATDAIEFANSSPAPDVGELLSHVYTEPAHVDQ